MLVAILEADAGAAFASTLPPWVAWVGFALSVVLATMKIYELVHSRRTLSSLSCSLTKDCFFRITENGESLFLNVVFSTKDRPAFVTAARATFHRRGEIAKTFPLALQRLGQPADRGGTINDHFFYSSSPLDVIEVNQPSRRVYLFTLHGYEDKFQAGFAELHNRLTAEAVTMRSAYQSLDAALQSQGVRIVQDAVEQFVQSINQNIQLEEADYRIVFEVDYRDVEGHGSRTHRTCRSEIHCTIPERTREFITNQLRTYGVETAKNVMGQSVTTNYPAVVPHKVVTFDSTHEI
jgi:hypothetical protein